jgi:hypothetical protein
MVVAVVSLLGSVTSLVGFVSTTAVTWRKERREQRHADVELEKAKLEVEKLRAELGRNEGQTPTTGDKPYDVS